MSDQAVTEEHSVRELFSYFVTILGPEKNYYLLAVVYGVGISVLSLGLPVSVQMLVNTIANTGLTTPLIVLTATLFGLLLAAGLLNALRIHLMDILQRRFYARMVAEIALRCVYSVDPFFEDQNKGALFNRYFDIIIVQKSMPDLLVGGFTVILQAVVGFTLVSMYHPLFLGFTLVVLFVIWLIWITWGNKAIRSSIQVSHKKHATAAWLEGLGASNGFYKSERHIAEALVHTDKVTNDYIDRHVRHFRHYFSQSICFMILYAIATAGLLGLGGWLVIEGELTLGQLVAAELVLALALLGISNLSTYLSYFYELCGAVDELSLFYLVEQEQPEAGYEMIEGDATLRFIEAQGDARGHPTTLNFTLPSGALVLSTVEFRGIQRELTNFLKRHDQPAGGHITLGGQDIAGLRAHHLRQQVMVLDRPHVIEMTIREYLQMSSPDVPSARVREALEAVGLSPAIAQLKNGIDTEIAATGWPLTITETMQVKLAAAIIAQPKVLVLGELYDTLVDTHLRNSFKMLRQPGETTVVYFSNRPRDLGFDHYLYLGRTEQKLLATVEELCRESRLGLCTTTPVPAGS